MKEIDPHILLWACIIVILVTVVTAGITLAHMSRPDMARMDWDMQCTGVAR